MSTGIVPSELKILGSTGRAGFDVSSAERFDSRARRYCFRFKLGYAKI